MPFIRKRRPVRRPFIRIKKSQPRSSEKKTVIFAFFVIIALCVAITLAGNFLKEISGQMALSEATDMITATINDKINEKMSEGQYTYDYFVNLQKDQDGNITAISTNMARINTLSSEILQEVIASTNSGLHDLSIPLGNLTGSNLLLGRGPNIPVKILMMTSSYANFRNELSSAGINQVTHQIILEVKVKINVLLPWEVKSTEVVSEVLIAETVLVGKVPSTYLNLNQP